MVVVGDPDDCAKAVQRWVDIGADQLCFSPTTNNMRPGRRSIASMELFGKEVSRSSTRIRCTRRLATARLLPAT